MKNKRILYVIVFVLLIASIAFRVLNDYRLEQTTLLFVGLPTLITLLLIKYSKTPKSMYGVVFKVITLFLLMSAILFGEGLVCIIFMAPIFYGTAALIIGIIKYIKKNDKSKLSIVIIAPLFLLYSEIHQLNSEPELQIVSTSITLNETKDLKSFNKSPNFLDDLPRFFKIGFPKPISIEGKGIEKGDFRKIKFLSKTKGVGTLLLRIKQKNKNTIVFEVESDDTHINHWLTWKEIIVEIKEKENNISEINWTTKYTCDLGPNWYFVPLEAYGVEVMNKHLIQSFFQ